MPKVATRYYDVDPWKIIETGFNEERAMVSESIFSLANEYMGSRGNFEEGYSGKKLIGNYYNGIYEVPDKQETGGYLGISKKNHYMVNSPNWAYYIIKINNELVDLHNKKVEEFKRVLDLKTGLLERSYVYTVNDSKVKIKFKKILGLKNYHHSYSVLEIIALDDKIDVEVIAGNDLSILHWGHQKCYNLELLNQERNSDLIIGKTKNTKQLVLQYNEYYSNYESVNYKNNDIVGKKYVVTLNKNEHFNLEKRIEHYNLKKENIQELMDNFNNNHQSISFDETIKLNKEHLNKIWEFSDIEIDGDEINQQGIRYSIFSLITTYQGLSLNNNIGAKGLTGEAYSGHAFWDTETYCLPFYLFSNQQAAKDLLLFRYHTLENAKARARELDCEGACYPIATLNGDEACNLWQHASLQFQPTSGVAYGIYHYVNVTKDYEFLFDYGIEMLIEISRFFASRGAYNHNGKGYGYYGVMGPDEFQMMVNHNTYTNYMAKKSMEYTIESLELLKNKDLDKYLNLIKKLNITQKEINDFKDKIRKMIILYDKKTDLFEQHQGYYDLPHIDIKSIPVTDFPLYSHWSYDRVYRNDMIKQPDVLMLMLLYNQSFTNNQKLKNYEFYEPRTIHESSLSPSVHSILALELGKIKEGLNFFGFATRMDLDDYNRNTHEGLHLTSIFAAWLNIVYGFGGLRSDGKILKLAPILPDNWISYTFNIKYLDAVIEVKVLKEEVNIKTSKPISLILYNDEVLIDGVYKWKK